LESLSFLLMQIAQAREPDHVWQLAVDYFRGLGFPLVNYGFTKFRSAKNIGDPDDAMFLTTGSAAYANTYFNQGFYAKTPAFRWVQNNDGAKTWTWIREAALAGKLTDEEMETLRVNAAMGIVAGLSISFPETSSRAKGAMGLIAAPGMDHVDVDRIFEHNESDMLSVAHMMHLKLIQLPISGRRRRLTLRQCEALEWVADGKTSHDVALLMGVSAAMVEKHLKLARETLCVETTSQAVAKATLMNLIFLSAEGSSVNPLGIAAR
jgi:DNA-binding CsgD family transcriptional regulator